VDPNEAFIQRRRGAEKLQFSLTDGAKSIYVK